MLEGVGDRATKREFLIEAGGGNVRGQDALETAGETPAQGQKRGRCLTQVLHFPQKQGLFCWVPETSTNRLIPPAFSKNAEGRPRRAVR